MQATLKIVSQKGVSGLTTAEIAKEVGVSEAAIFRHFSSKNEILVATLYHVRDTLLRWSRARIAGTGSPMEKLGDILRFHLELFERNKAIPKIIFSEQIHQNERLCRVMRETIDEYMGLIGTLIQEGMEKGQFRSDLDVRMVTSVYLGLVQVSVLQWSLRGCDSSLTAEYGRMLHFISSILKK